VADQSSSEMSYPCSLASYGSERATLISASQWRGARLRLNLRGEAAVEDHLHKTRAWLRQATLTSVQSMERRGAATRRRPAVCS
jgi:hypothetical protein